jgi:hypothetical protein
MYDILTPNTRAAGRAAMPPSTAAIDRRQNPRPEILRIALTLPPSHHRSQHLALLEANHTFPRSGIPFSDSTQPGYALESRLRVNRHGKVEE